MSEPVAMKYCPTANELSEFIDGVLPAEQLPQIRAHIADCAECRDRLLLEQEMQDFDAGFSETATSDAAPNVKPFRAKTTLWTLAAAIAVAAAIVLIFGPMIRARYFTPSEIREIATLSAVLENRPLEGRLGGDFSYQPAYFVKRADEEKGAVENQVHRLRQKLEATANAEPSVKNLHASAVAQFYDHDFEGGLTSLSRALSIETGESDLRKAIDKSTDAKLLSDLAAALLLEREDKIQEANQKLASLAAERAWSLDENEATAWNRALATQAAGSSADAINAWNDYLKLDSKSKWADEARDHLRALQ